MMAHMVQEDFVLLTADEFGAADIVRIMEIINVICQNQKNQNLVHGNAKNVIWFLKLELSYSSITMNFIL